MHPILKLSSRVLYVAAMMLPLADFTGFARADIFQWEYINPANPSQGKQQSTMLAPDGAGVDAEHGADLISRNLTMAYLIGVDLTDAYVGRANLTNADLSLANLTNASLQGATLTGTTFTGAEVRGASLGRDLSFSGVVVSTVGTGITLDQIYSTASYQARQLTGIRLFLNNLAGGNFANQNLSNGFFEGATLTGANLSQANLTNASLPANLDGADLTGADARGAYLRDAAHAITTNLIQPDGHISGLNLDAGGLLVIRDYDGDSRGEPDRAPISITIDQHLTMGPGGTLRMVFEADAWDSTISFTPGVPVTLGGTLDLTLANDVNLASQVGRTFHVFDWSGVNPIGAFAVSSPYRWNLSNLYTTGEVTLTAVPEPSTFILAGAGILALIAGTRRQNRGLAPCG